MENKKLCEHFNLNYDNIYKINYYYYFNLYNEVFYINYYLE